MMKAISAPMNGGGMMVMVTKPSSIQDEDIEMSEDFWVICNLNINY